MAIVLGFRLAVMLTPVIYRTVASGGSTPFTPVQQLLQQQWSRLTDPTEDPVVLSTELSAMAGEGSYILVTDYSAPFETRKLSVRWARSPAGMVAEDVDVIGIQFLKAPGGVPTNSWLDSDYTTLETAFGSLWNTLKVKYPSYMVLSQYRWYADGPALHPPPPEGNPARRVTDLTVAGTSGAIVNMPPQDAESVTFKTSTRRGWGRVYMPAMHGDSLTLNANGNLTTAATDLLASSWVTFLNAARAASLVPVVFSLTHSKAMEILIVQVDDLIDIQRRRRWKRADYKKQTTLT